MANDDKPTVSSSKLSVSFFFSSVSEGSVIFLFVLLILSARILGDEQFGVFSFALAFVSVFGFMMHGGLRFVYTRDVSRDASLTEQYMGNVLTLQMMYSLLGMVLIILFVSFTDKSPETQRIVYIMGMAEGLRFFKYTFRFIFRVADRYDLETYMLLFERISLLVAGLLVLTSGGGVIGFALVFLAVRLVDLVLVVLLTTRTVAHPQFRFDTQLWPSLLRFGFPFMLNAAATLLLYNVDSVLLSLMRTDAEVGWYNAAYRLLDGFYLFPQILSATLYPSLARLYGDDKRMLALYRRGIKYAMFLALPISIIGVVLAEDLILFIYGREFINAVPALQIILLGMSFIFIHEVSVVLLSSIHRQTIAFYISITVLTLNVVLNLLLIPHIGYLGAGLATLASEMTFSIVVTIYVFSKSYRLHYLQLIWRPMVASTLIAVLIGLLDLHIILSLVVGGLGYLILVTLLGNWDEIERGLVRKAFGSVLNRG